jgi:hypothetical protein
MKNADVLAPHELVKPALWSGPYKPPSSFLLLTAATLLTMNSVMKRRIPKIKNKEPTEDRSKCGLSQGVCNTLTWCSMEYYNVKS